MFPHSPVAADGGTDRVAVLMYHRVGPLARADEARYAVTPGRFAAQMQALADSGFHAVRIDDLVAWLDGGPALVPGSFVITFDDGYLGVREHAMPVLQRLGWPFAIFIVTEFLGGVDAWQRNNGTASGRHPLLAAEDVQDMASHGVSFHSHTCRHLSLPGLSDSELQSELVESRAALECMLGQGERYVAYPYGHTDDRVVAAALQAGYKAGFSVQPGFNRRNVGRFHIRRLDIVGTDTPDMLLRKVHFGSNDGSRMASVRYASRRIADRLGWRDH